MISGHAPCDEDGGQHDVGYQCVVTRRNVLSIRSSLLVTTAGARLLSRCLLQRKAVLKTK